MTIGAKEGEHWWRLWLVVIDAKLYAQLGDRALKRVQKNIASPYVQVKIAGQRFDRVRAEAAPEMADKVAAAMAEKYFPGYPGSVRVAPNDGASRCRSGLAMKERLRLPSFALSI